MMQVIKIGQTKLFVIMQGCIINLIVLHPFFAVSHPLFYETPCIYNIAGEIVWFHTSHEYYNSSGISLSDTGNFAFAKSCMNVIASI